MTLGRDGLNEVAMGCERKAEHISYCNIPGLEDPVNFIRVQVPQTAAIEAAAIDIEKFHENLRFDKMKLLE